MSRVEAIPDGVVQMLQAEERRLALQRSGAGRNSQSFRDLTAIHELAKRQFGVTVNRTSVRRALEVLERDGRVRRRPTISGNLWQLAGDAAVVVVDERPLERAAGGGVILG